jgi:hypothetical protein
MPDIDYKKSLRGKYLALKGHVSLGRAGKFKCNIDASFSFTQNRVGIGMHIWDAEGNFVQAKTEWFSPICSVEEGEAIRLLIALQWVNDLQIENIDSKLD